MQRSAKVKGLRNQERIDIKEINDDFVVDFPLSACQKAAIEIIYNMRAVTMSQLVEITGYNYKYLTREMLKLHLNRFIERCYPPKERNQKGTNESYFLLDQAGAIYISGIYEIQMKEVRWIRRDNLIKPEKLNHTFQISGIRARLEVEARKNEHSIINCVSDRHLFLNFKYEDREFTLRPDMYFKYLAGKKQYNYFVECDLGTMAITGPSPKTMAFEKKVDYYEAYKLSQAYKEVYNVFPRVLVITTTTDRAVKLMQAVKERQKERPRADVDFLFTSLTLWNDNPTNEIFVTTDNRYTNMFE